MSVMTFTKKPVEIEAAQFTGLASAPTVVGWVLDHGGTARWHEHMPAQWDEETGKGCPEDPEHLSIDTLEGTMRADVGDWIIKGVLDEFYPCKPDIFRATYQTDEGGWCEGCGDLVLYESGEIYGYDAEGGVLCGPCFENADRVMDTAEADG